MPRPGSPVPSTPERREGLRACYWEGPSELPERRSSSSAPRRNPVGEGTTRRGTATPVHRPQSLVGSTHSSKKGLRPPEQLERQVEFPSSDKTRPDSPVPTLQVRKIPWSRKWQPTPVFLAGKSHGQRSLEGYGSWGRKESDMTEGLNCAWLASAPLSPSLWT